MLLSAYFMPLRLVQRSSVITCCSLCRGSTLTHSRNYLFEPPGKHLRKQMFSSDNESFVFTCSGKHVNEVLLQSFHVPLMTYDDESPINSIRRSVIYHSLQNETKILYMRFRSRSFKQNIGAPNTTLRSVYAQFLLVVFMVYLYLPPHISRERIERSFQFIFHSRRLLIAKSKE